MFSYPKESIGVVASGIKVFCTFFFFGLAALMDWLKGFSLINQWVFIFLVPKLIIISIGYVITPFPLWFLVVISFVSMRIVSVLFFLAFIYMFAHF